MRRFSSISKLVIAATAITSSAAIAVSASGAAQAHDVQAQRATAGRGGAHAVRERTAHAANTIDGSDTAHLHLIRQDETVLYEEGAASGELPGSMSAKLKVGSLFTGTCTIKTSHGSVTGHGIATPHGTGRYQSFRGTLTITSGSGRYAHVHGKTALYGTFDRRTFDLIIHTSGKLSY